jgi:hypothetical protein
MPEIDDFIRCLVNNGLNIVNIGFPPHNCDVQSNNYMEISDDLSQEELLSLFYLSRGVLMQANAGGFVSHFSSNVDMFFYSEQWFLPGEFDNFDLLSHKNKLVSTEDISQHIKPIDGVDVDMKFYSIVKLLTNHKKKFNLLFSDDKPTIYVK